MFKFNKKILVILTSPLLIGGMMYYVVNAYIEPGSLFSAPNTKIDVGTSSQNKLGKLSIGSLLGTTTISSSSVLLITDSGRGMLISTSTNNNQTFAVQLNNGDVVPVGFMWKRGNNGGLYINGGLSVGTTLASNSLIITNGTPSSSVVNIGGDASNTIAVGAYYDKESKAWKVTDPRSAQSPMAIAFDPNGGLWLEAGGTPPDQQGVFYWRNSMHITTSGDVIFSDRYATSSYKIWTGMTKTSTLPNPCNKANNCYVADAEKYCEYTTSTNCADASSTKIIVRVVASFNVNPRDIECKAGDTIYFYPVKTLTDDKPYVYVKYTCSVGDNNPVYNKSTVVGGNFFVADQNYYTDPQLKGSPKKNDDPWKDNWATCPDGYLMSGVSLGGVQCSKLTIPELINYE